MRRLAAVLYLWMVWTCVPSLLKLLCIRSQTRLSEEQNFELVKGEHRSCHHLATVNIYKDAVEIHPSVQVAIERRMLLTRLRSRIPRSAPTTMVAGRQITALRNAGMCRASTEYG